MTRRKITVVLTQLEADSLFSLLVSAANDPDSADHYTPRSVSAWSRIIDKLRTATHGK